MSKKILLQFTDLYNMTCVYCRVVCASKQLPVVFKKRLKLCFWAWTRMTWPRICESTFPSKISSHKSWKTSQLSNMLSNNVPLRVQRFEHNFQVQSLLSTCWKLLAFLESIGSLFNSKDAPCPTPPLRGCFARFFKLYKW